MYKLVIAEKPSVGQSLAAVLGASSKKDGYMEGGGYLVSWCIGHLLGLASADAYDEKYGKWRYSDLPIIPANWKHTPAKDRKKQLGVLAALMKRADVDCVINACDAGREGELIFRLVYEHCGCDKPMQRLWISSMEDSAIREGFANLRPGSDYDSLYAAALCREKADWLVGINATRLFSVHYGNTLNVGRVVSPTLAMLVQREAEISAFVKEPFYTVELDTGSFTAASAKMPDITRAENIRATCDGANATVAAIELVDKTAAPPKLYDLTTLQREANRMWGYTAQQTLDYVQSLYDKKLATYPRTDSRFLTEDMETAIPVLVNLSALIVPGVRGKVAIGADIGRVINNKKVSDHHAIIPTMEIKDADLAALPAGERNILHMLAVRLVCAVQEPHTWDETTVVLDCGGLRFTAKGKTVTENGWKAVEQAYRAALKDKPDDAEDGDANMEKSLPELTEGQIFDNVSAALKEGFTSPPKHFTEDTLLSAMETAGAGDTDDDVERKGLGTPATRASIIEKLVRGGFVERKKKALLPMKKGVNLVTVLPESVKSPQLTAEWENRLKQLERGEFAATDFMDGIASFTSEIVRENAAAIPEYTALFPKPISQSETVGVCPRCGGEVREGKKGFFCGDRDCGFKLWNDNRFFTAKKKPLSAAVVKALLKDGRVALTGLYSEKTGKTYDAIVLMEPGEKGGKYVNFKLEFNKKKGGK